MKIIGIIALSLFLLYQGAEALQCAPDVCPSVEAHLIPDAMGTSAGAKIAAAIASLPAGIGGYVDATGFANPQNLSGFTIPSGVTVKLGPIFHTLPCGTPITVNQGGRLIGSGTNSPGATWIKLFNDCNHDVVQAVSTAGPLDWWHSGEIAWLRIDGNKANNTSGDGLQVHTIGEISHIHNLIVVNAVEAGLRHIGGTAGTNSIENVFVADNGEAGILLEDFSSQIVLKSVGGDRNPSTFLIRNPKTGGGSVYILSLKSEGKFEFTESVVTIEGGSAPVHLTIAGGTSISGFRENLQTIVTLKATGREHFINIVGATFYNIGAVIDDQRNNSQLVPEGFVDSEACTIFTVGGSVCRIMDLHYYDGSLKSFPAYVEPGPPLPVYDLSVTKAGTGTGLITESATGIDCGAVCLGSADEGASINFVVQPDTNMQFDGWSGDPECSTAFVLVQTMACTATFTDLGGVIMSELHNITHEVGDFSEYTSETDAQGDLNNSTPGLGGTTNAAYFTIDDTVAMRVDLSVVGLGATENLRFRYYVDTTNLTIPDGFLFQGMTLNRPGAGNRLHFIHRNDSGVIGFRSVLALDSGNNTSPTIALSAGEHTLEARVIRASSDVASDASITVWLDGDYDTPVYEATGLDLFDLTQVSNIRNQVTTIGASVSGTYITDEIILRNDTTEIGLVPSGGGSGQARLLLLGVG